MGFLEMMTSFPGITDRVKLKMAKRITNFIKEERACRLYNPSSILHSPEVQLFLPSERSSPWVLPCRDSLDKNSYADPKLGHMSRNTHISVDSMGYSNDLTTFLLL